VKRRYRVVGFAVANCPSCGASVETPEKKWALADRPNKIGKRLQLEIGLFECPNCKKPFRAVLSKQKI
jgi:uncharacterized protein (UPF0212 family)